MRVSALLLGLLSGLLGIIVAAVIGAFSYFLGTINDEMLNAGSTESAVTETVSQERIENEAGSSAQLIAEIEAFVPNEEASKLIQTLVDVGIHPEFEAKAVVKEYSSEEVVLLTKLFADELTDAKQLDEASMLLSANERIIQDVRNAESSLNQSAAESDIPGIEDNQSTKSGLTNSMMINAIINRDIEGARGKVSDEEFRILSEISEGNFDSVADEVSADELEMFKIIQNDGITVFLVHTLSEEVAFSGSESVFKWLKGYVLRFKDKSTEDIMTQAVIVAILSLLGFVGSMFAIAKQRASAIIMLVAGIGGFIIVADIYLVSTVLFIFAALLAFFAKKSVKKKDMLPASVEL